MSIASLRDRLFGGAGGRVFRGMAALAMGAGLARLIGLASIPLLTRIYSPEDFGLLSVFTAFVLMLMPVLTLRYGMAIPLPEDDGEAMNLAVLSGMLLVVLTAFSTLCLWLWHAELFALVGMETLGPVWWLLTIGLVGSGIYDLLSMWATRRRDYRTLAQTQIFQSALGEAHKLGLGVLGWQPLGLIIGQIVAHSGGCLSFLLRFRTDFRRLRHRIGMGAMLAAARKWQDFPLYRMPSQFLLVFAMQIPLPLASVFYGEDAAGQLGLATMALALPFNLVGQSMSRAYYAEIAALGAGQPALIRHVTLTVLKRMGLLAVPITLLLFFGGEPLFSLAFGENWQLAGRIAAILSVMLVFQFCSSPLLELFNLYGGQRVYMQIHLQRAVLTVGAFLFAAFMHMPLTGAIMLYAAALSLHYMIVTARILTTLRRNTLMAGDKNA